MNNQDITTTIGSIIDKDFHIEKAVLTMKGVGLMLQEYIEGNSFPMISADNQETVERLEDILCFASRALLDGAEDLWSSGTELESRIMGELRAYKG